MTCNPDIVYLYLENELSAPEGARVEAHLQECAACAARGQAQRAVLHDLDELLDVTTPVWLEQQITERTYEDLTTTLHSHAERGRAVIVVTALSVATVGLLSLSTVAHYLLQFFRGLQVAASVLWDVTTVFLKGLSLVTIGVVHGLADEAQVTPLLAVLMAAMLSLVLLRLVLRFDVPANEK
jgi:hypothetical protein